MNKERRVVNLFKPEFDTIKKYCIANGLSMPRWIELQCRRAIADSRNAVIQPPVTPTNNNTVEQQ